MSVGEVYPAHIRRRSPEDLYRVVAFQDETYGHLDLTDRDTCFCWCFWSFKIPSSDLKTIPAIMVRAMDEGLSGQPQEMCRCNMDSEAMLALIL